MYEIQDFSIFFLALRVRVGRGNLVLRHSFPQIPSNFWRIVVFEWRNWRLHFCFEIYLIYNNYEFLRVNQPTTVAYNQTLVPLHHDSLNFNNFSIMIMRKTNFKVFFSLTTPWSNYRTKHFLSILVKFMLHYIIIILNSEKIVWKCPEFCFVTVESITKFIWVQVIKNHFSINVGKLYYVS